MSSDIMFWRWIRIITTSIFPRAVTKFLFVDCRRISFLSYWLALRDVFGNTLSKKKGRANISEYPPL